MNEIDIGQAADSPSQNKQQAELEEWSGQIRANKHLDVWIENPILSPNLFAMAVTTGIVCLFVVSLAFLSAAAGL
jgi:hypothetical protein